MEWHNMMRLKPFLALADFAVPDCIHVATANGGPSTRAFRPQGSFALDAIEDGPDRVQQSLATLSDLDKLGFPDDTFRLPVSESPKRRRFDIQSKFLSPLAPRT
jgi:hypothetical protein